MAGALPWVGALAPVAASIFGASKQSSAASSAAKSQAQAQRDALAFQREQAAEERRRYEEQQRYAREQWDRMQALLAPYRAASAGILRSYGFTGGIPAPAMPPDWVPGQSAAPTVPKTPTPYGSGPEFGDDSTYYGAPRVEDSLPPLIPPAASGPRTLADLTAAWRL